MTPRNKFSAWTSAQYHCLSCDGGGDGTGLGFGASISSPEATQTNENHPSSLTQLSWTSPYTNRLLLEANAQLGPYFWWGSRQKNSYDATTIQVQDTGGAVPGINYRSSNWSGHTGTTNIFQGAVSYITGSHSTKFGFRYHHNMSTFPKNFYNNTQLKYTFQDGVPTNVTAYADQASEQEQQQTMFAFYAQDRWTINRLSVQAGLRFEHLSDYFPEQRMGPNRFLPTAVVFPAEDGPLNQKDLMPRIGASYDVFGNGKTAAEVLHGPVRHDVQHRRRMGELQPRRSQQVCHLGQPGLDRREPRLRCRLQLPEPGAQRRVRPRECVLREANLSANGRSLVCRRMEHARGQLGYHRGYHAGGRAGESRCRLITSAGAGETCRPINRAWTPADFDTFVFNVPQDSRLPGGGGYPVTFRDIKPAKYQQIDNYLTFADNVGGASNNFNGVDVTVNARLHAVTLQGGTSTGNSVEDGCGVVTQHPEFYIFGSLGRDRDVR